MNHIFVVDDEKRIRDLIDLYLKKEGYKVTTFPDAEEVLESFEKQKPDLLVLDIMMPGIDGLDLCKKIREISDVPIIFVSARSEELDRILGLELGGDDYLGKPFSPRELVVRIKTILKRAYKEKKESDTEDIIKIKNLELFIDRRIIKINNEDVQFTIKEFEVLEYLMKNTNMPLSREQIISTVWGYDYDGYDRNVDDTVKRLRKKLKEHGSQMKISTVWGYGYRVDKNE
ncbi:DNA-binding response OmpR family regulator [Acetoanaerobium pronyense]|uniref:Stage 0 sporulation protein A homolog n=1 Tax=Acetoanaerobium pronyense TaxID=1482736 RepID=A0ABS4KKC6_9FIRM|nr:DNA-binding response OmpR family regulator [Acetoanaerobium pronyense]